MTHSEINPHWPVYGHPTTESVRENFEHARDEINEIDEHIERIDGEVETLQDKVEELEEHSVQKTPTGDLDISGNITCHELIAKYLRLTHIPVHLDNASAHLGGLPVGTVYRDFVGILKIVY